MTAALEMLGVTKAFGEADQAPAVYNLSLAVAQGNTLALVGPSGCGKTTTLRLIAGFETPDEGTILLGGRVVADRRRCLAPERRGVGMVFQDHNLFPHLTVAENVTFGLSKLPRRRVAEEVRHFINLVGLSGMQDRYPHELSGGERQRVALARALAPRPVIVLLDEPFSNLDADRRARMRDEVRFVLKQTGSTALFVTHDQDEALFMGDVVAVMRAGRLEQIGTPEEVFHSPASRFVAEFLGRTEFLPATVSPAGVVTELGTLPQVPDLPPGTPVEVGVRADDVSFAPDRQGQAMVLSRFFQGAANLYRLRLASGRILHSIQAHTRSLPPGTPVRVWLEPNHPLPCFANGKAVATK